MLPSVCEALMHECKLCTVPSTISPEKKHGEKNVEGIWLLQCLNQGVFIKLYKYSFLGSITMGQCGCIYIVIYVLSMTYSLPREKHLPA